MKGGTVIVHGGSEECCIPIMLERGTLLPGEGRLGWLSGMLLFSTLFRLQMHRALSDWWSFLAECDIHGYQGRENGERVHKKPQIKGCSLCLVSVILCWNGRNAAGRQTVPQSPQPLMNFKRTFSFKAGCWLAACCPAKHSGKEEEKRTGGSKGTDWEKEVLAGRGSWHPGRVGIGCPSQRQIMAHSAWEATGGTFLTQPRGFRESQVSTKRKEWAKE